MVHTARGSYINHRFCFSLLSSIVRKFGSCPCMDFYMVINSNIRKRYQSTKGLYVQISGSVISSTLSPPGRYAYIPPVLPFVHNACQMFRLQFIYIHKRNQRNHSQEEQRQYKCCFYCQTSLLNLSPKRGAERYFYRRNFSNMFFCICPKIFPTLLGE